MCDNDVIDPFDITQHLVVPESQDAESLSLQPCCSRAVLLSSVAMLPAIDLDDEPSIEADEIDDVGANRHLSAEAMTIDLLKAKLCP
jgi:hypothetical protein